MAQNKSYLDFTDQMDEENPNEPYTSISTRDPLEDLSIHGKLDRKSDGQDNNDDIYDLSWANNIRDSLGKLDYKHGLDISTRVKGAVKNKIMPPPPPMPPEPPAPEIEHPPLPPAAAKPEDAPPPLGGSPSAPQEESPESSRSYRSAMPGSYFTSNFAQAMAQAAQGTHTPQINNALYSNMAAQDHDMLSAENSEQNRRAKVMQAIRDQQNSNNLNKQQMDFKSRLADQSNKNNLDIVNARNKNNLDVSEGRNKALLDAAKIRSQNSDFQISKFDISRFDRANSQINDEIQKGNSPFAIAARNKQSIANVRALVSGHADPNDLPPQQVFETAKALDRIISQGQPTDLSTGHLTPGNAGTWLANKISWFTNQPTGANQGAYIKLIMSTLDREETNALKTIHQAKIKTLSSYMDLKDKYPEKWKTMMKIHGLDEPETLENEPEPDKAPINDNQPSSRSPSVMIKNPDTGLVHEVPSDQADAAVTAGGIRQ